MSGDPISSSGAGSAGPQGNAELRAAEDALQAAMLAGDAEALDGLLHQLAVYVGPDGTLVDRSADLQAHSSGALLLRRYDELERLVIATGTTGLTVVLVALEGESDGHPFAARMRYHRTWVREPTGWQILAASGNAG